MTRSLSGYPDEVVELKYELKQLKREAQSKAFFNIENLALQLRI